MKKSFKRRGCEGFKKRVQSCLKRFRRTEVWFTDLYLTTDLLWLDSVFEAFRKVCYQNLWAGLRLLLHGKKRFRGRLSKNLYARPETVNGLWTSGLCAATDTRGGMSSVYTRRFYKANNKYLDDFSPWEPTSYILKIDAKKLYAGTMKQCPLPFSRFFNSDQTIFQ